MEISRKISGSTLSARINIKASKARRYLGRIYGIAASSEPVDTAFGVPAIKFNGEFVAHRVDGETSTAPVAYLPPVCIPTVEEMLVEHGPAKFAFDFFVQTEGSAVRWYFTTLELSPADSPLAFAALLPSVDTIRAANMPAMPTPPAGAADPDVLVSAARASEVEPMPEPANKPKRRASK